MLALVLASLVKTRLYPASLCRLFCSLRKKRRVHVIARSKQLKLKPRKIERTSCQISEFTVGYSMLPSIRPVLNGKETEHLSFELQ